MSKVKYSNSEKAPTPRQYQQMDAILEIIAGVVRLPVDKILERKRNQYLIWARSLYMFLCRNLYGIGYAYLTEFDHTTALHHCERLACYFDAENCVRYGQPEFCLVIAEVVEKLRENELIDFDRNFLENAPHLEPDACSLALTDIGFMRSYVRMNLDAKLKTSVYYVERYHNKRAGK